VFALLNDWMPVSDVEVGRWLALSLEEHWSRTKTANYITAVVPKGYAAYARLLHPAYRGSEDRELTWAQVAKLTGRSPHAQMQWHAVSRFRDLDTCLPGIIQPCTGYLPDKQARILAEILCRHTNTPETCYFAIWEGWGFPEVEGLRDKTTRLCLPDRTYYLLKGNLEKALISGTHFSLRPVNIWWPEDRQWCAATEVDLMWTYVAGSEACISEILDSGRLEAWRATLDDRLDLGSDEINN
jgi:hypothetical protein